MNLATTEGRFAHYKEESEYITATLTKFGVDAPAYLLRDLLEIVGKLEELGLQNAKTRREALECAATARGVANRMFSLLGWS